MRYFKAIIGSRERWISHLLLWIFICKKNLLSLNFSPRTYSGILYFLFFFCVKMINNRTKFFLNSLKMWFTSAFSGNMNFNVILYWKVSKVLGKTGLFNDPTVKFWAVFSHLCASWKSGYYIKVSGLPFSVGKWWIGHRWTSFSPAHKADISALVKGRMWIKCVCFECQVSDLYFPQLLLLNALAIFWVSGSAFWTFSLAKEKQPPANICLLVSSCSNCGDVTQVWVAKPNVSALFWGYIYSSSVKGDRSFFGKSNGYGWDTESC